MKSKNNTTRTINDLEILTELNSTERQIVKFVYHWDKEIPPNTNDIYKGLKIKQSTISSTLKRMKESKKLKKDIFNYKPHHDVTLTAYGKRIAEHLEHHHHIMEIYLHQSLGLDELVSHQESELLGLSVSCNLTNIISEKFNITKEKLGQYCICPEEKTSECVLK